MGVQRLGAASMPGRWCGREASMRGKWRAILLQYCGNETQPWRNFESNRGGSPMQGISAFPVSQMVYILPERLLAREGFEV